MRERGWQLEERKDGVWLGLLWLTERQADLLCVTPVSGFPAPGTQKSRSFLFRRLQSDGQIPKKIPVQQAWNLPVLWVGIACHTTKSLASR